MNTIETMMFLFVMNIMNELSISAFEVGQESPLVERKKMNTGTVFDDLRLE
jgi:hypothetical protein